MKLRLLIVGAALTATTAASLAQDYPARPIRLILGFAPGGSTDLVARVVGQKMAEAWAQQVVVDNRPGANGMIGADLVAKANPDGYSLLLSSIGPMAINASFYKMPYDIVAELKNAARDREQAQRRSRAYTRAAGRCGEARGRRRGNLNEHAPRVGRIRQI